MALQLACFSGAWINVLPVHTGCGVSVPARCRSAEVAAAPAHHRGPRLCTQANPNARGPGAHGGRAQQAASQAEAAQVPAYFATHHAPHRISPGKHHQPLHDKDKHHQLHPLDTSAGSAAYQPGLGLSLRAQRRREKPTPKGQE